MLVDSHAHLDDPRFAEDLEEVLARAASVGVTSILTVGCVGPDNDGDAVLRILDRFPGTYASFGVHPHDARHLNDALEGRLEKLLEHPKALAVGEIGLDYYYGHSPREAQLEAFARQIGLARRLGKPIVVHTRDAEDDTILRLEGGGSEPAASPGILHCFSGSWELAARGLELGFLVSFGGMVTFQKADLLREVLRSIPEDRLLVETDAPYLAPVPHRGKRNEPCYLPLVVEQAARLRDRTTEALGRVTTENFFRLFELPGLGTHED